MTGRHDRSPGPASAAGIPGPGTSHELIEAALAEAHRREWAFVLAATVRTARDLDLAEECVQEAYAAAVTAWARDGVPASPAAWLTTTARRRAVDTIRRDRTFRSKLPLLIEPDDDRTSVEDTAMNELTRSPDGAAPEALADERLRLIFLCCHPALAPDGQVALTLRLVCGISTSDIARAFLCRSRRWRPGSPVQEEDRRQPDPVPDAVRRRADRSARAGAAGDLSVVHHRPHRAGRPGAGPRRPVRRGDPRWHVSCES